MATVGWIATPVPAPGMQPGDGTESPGAVPTPSPPADEVPIDVEPTATSEPTPEPPAAPVDIRAIICSVPWPCAEALLVVYGPTPPNDRAPRGCPNGESSGNPLAVSRGGHRGLLQLSEIHTYRFERRGWTWDEAFDPWKNVAIAFELFDETDDWRHWSCRP